MTKFLLKYWGIVAICAIVPWAYLTGNPTLELCLTIFQFLSLILLIYLLRKQKKIDLR